MGLETSRVWAKTIISLTFVSVVISGFKVTLSITMRTYSSRARSGSFLNLRCIAGSCGWQYLYQRRLTCKASKLQSPQVPRICISRESYRCETRIQLLARKPPITNRMKITIMAIPTLAAKSSTSFGECIFPPNFLIPVPVLGTEVKN